MNLSKGDPEEDLGELVRQLESPGVPVVEEKILRLFGIAEGKFGVKLENGRELLFDRVFSTLGMYKMNNELAAQLDGKIDDEGTQLLTVTAESWMNGISRCRDCTQLENQLQLESGCDRFRRRGARRHPCLQRVFVSLRQDASQQKGRPVSVELFTRQRNERHILLLNH